ncbi:NFACT family protein [Candidatus Bathyarchaeota archaeon]|nr:NFACT family protein [Candidatus Bathyarchaeota archaeon]
MKESMTAFDIAAAVSELSNLVRGSRIGKIYQLNHKILLLKLRNPGGESLQLLIEAGRRIHITKYDLEKPKKPPNFCMALRKHLENGVIEDISQYDFERISELLIRRGGQKYRLIAELFDEGNIILVGSENEILYALTYKKMRDRNILQGENFKYPPQRGKDLRHAGPEEIREIKGFGQIDIVRALTRFLGIGGLYAEEILLRSGIDKNRPCSSLTDGELSAILNSIMDLASQIGNWKPCIFIDETGAWVDTAPFPLKRYSGLNMMEMGTFNDALDEYYAKIMLKGEVEKSKDIYEGEIANLKRILQEQEENLRELTSKVKVYRQIGDKIYSHLYELDFLINRIMNEKRSGKNWDEISEVMLKEKEKSVVPSIHFASINPKTLTLQVSVDGQIFDLNLKMSAQKNAAEYYEKAKKMMDKIKGLEKAIEQTKERIEKVRAEELEKEVAASTAIPVRRRREWYEKFRWFFSSENFLVLGGRDAATNEILIKRYMEPHDLIFHADIPGSPFVLIKTQGKTPEKTIEEAAQFTASYSRAWKEGLRALDVYWVKPEQVSKTPPSGEYLPRGSFMIYGTKNYVRNVTLEIAIGLKRENGAFRVIGGPLEAISKQTDLFVKVVPGSEPTGKLAKSIIKALAEMSPPEERTEILKIPLEEVHAFIPLGQGSISSS